ncbi:MAG: hypothetical protein HZA21_03025, partial [Nitrospirae bacterium]|nr:hypothetical protein [Nitrospirota bacterium]
VYTALREPLGDRAAQVIADTLAGVAADQRDQLVTKPELQLTKAELLQEIQKVRQEIQTSKMDLIKWMIGLMLAQLFGTVSLIKLLQ